MNIAHAVALLLDGLGLVDYDETGTAGDAFLGTMPEAPEQAVALTPYDAGPQDPANAYDVARVQLRVRGTTDPRVSHDRAYALYDALNGLADTALPDGTNVIICAARMPGPLGPDAARRHEHVVNAEIEYEAATAHRA